MAFARIRRDAIRKCEHWMLERMKHSEGLGAIYPPMQYSVMALDVLGYAKDHPVRVEAIRQFDRLMVDDGKTLFFQPCFSPVWDTAIGAYALGEASGAISTKAIQTSFKSAMDKAANWLLAREIRRKGDWSVKRPDTEPSGWAFEFQNDWYPDIDDTAMVLLALQYMPASDRARAGSHAMRRAIDWLLAMQSKDGGWAAFDVDNNWEILKHVPFADHNAMLDPTCPDITGRVLEALAANGYDRSHPACQRAIEYLMRTPGGRRKLVWPLGRGLSFTAPVSRCAACARWRKTITNRISSERMNGFVPCRMPMADGAKAARATTTTRYVAAESTPSQTAWALMGLMAGGDTYSSSVQNGIQYLVKTQREDGGWLEELATGTGFPKVFYLNYHYYRLYFPLMALATFVKVSEADR